MRRWIYTARSNSCDNGYLQHMKQNEGVTFKRDLKGSRINEKRWNSDRGYEKSLEIKPKIYSSGLAVVWGWWQTLINFCYSYRDPICIFHIVSIEAFIGMT